MSSAAIIDSHCHVLPGMDDGSPDLDTSLEMLRRQAGQGVGTVCCTSHYYAHRETVAAFCARREKAMDRLRSALTPDLPRLLAASETAFFTGISECPDLDRLCIQGTRTLLLEMPFAVWNDFQMEEVTALVLDRGVQVMLAHPERFCAFKGNRERLRRLEELPAAYQINAGALLSWRTRHLALELLREARFPLLASDSHNLTRRAPNLQEGRRAAAQRLGNGFLDRLDQTAAAWLKPAAPDTDP